ncbi:MAG: hypothetical protein ACUVTP_12990 [Candidatus Fervidibacter sp.]|uniref:hypothetical protein n=1 Tax=Candidatus Fervidibacter sp. TaxID=3100871 RepID=UPI00404B20F5
MEKLLEAIERVRERIRQHEAQLRQSEMLTRYALVDPILRALGWDTENPEQVVPEFSRAGRRSDYALLHDGNPHVMVEVKPLGTALGGAAEQGVRAAVTLGMSYFACTNGNVWELYDAHKPVPLEQKRVFQARIVDDNPAKLPANSCLSGAPLCPK